MSELLTLTVEGRCYDFGIERITGEELRELKRKYGLTLKTLMPAVAETDPDALACFWWLLVRQNGRDYDRVPLNDSLEFPAGALYAALQELDEGEDEPEEAEPDPTPASSSPTGSAASPERSTRPAGTRPPRAGQPRTRSPRGSGTADTTS